MWLRDRRRNALLAPLAPVVGGERRDGAVRGSYGGFAVEARPHAGYPIRYLSGNPEGSVGPEPANMFEVTLVGVPGGRAWHCQSAAGSALHDLASRFTAGPLLGRFPPGEFRFEGADPLSDAAERGGERLAQRLGMPVPANADPQLQQRLIEAGLFDELDALRLGGHPYLPRVRFVPSARELSERSYLQSPVFERARPALEQRLRAAGMPDLESVLEAKLREAEAEHPGRLQVDVEAGPAEVLSPEGFADVLGHALRIAEINAAVNEPPPPPA